MSTRRRWALTPARSRHQPRQRAGIELNEYAAELARVTVWIGELQWRLNHGYPFKQNPVPGRWITLSVGMRC